MPVITIRSADELRDHHRRLMAAARHAEAALKELTERGSPLRLLHAIKFDAIGRHPSEDRDLNLVEQVNQTFTYLVTFEAVRHLLQRHPDATGWRLNLGTAAGTDIESLDGAVVAEVFAAVRPYNNGKLLADVRRVSNIHARHRYVFFSAPGFAGPQPAKKDYVGVEIVAVELDVDDTSTG